jgi:hypothetical protein
MNGCGFKIHPERAGEEPPRLRDAPCARANPGFHGQGRRERDGIVFPALCR